MRVSLRSGESFEAPWHRGMQHRERFALSLRIGAQEVEQFIGMHGFGQEVEMMTLKPRILEEIVYCGLTRKEQDSAVGEEPA